MLYYSKAFKFIKCLRQVNGAAALVVCQKMNYIIIRGIIVGNIDSQYFDLSVLMRFGRISFLRVVRSNPTLQVGAYSDLLSIFLSNASKGTDALSKMVNHRASESDLMNLKGIKEMLDDIGYVKISSGIEEIIKTASRGHAEFASSRIPKVLANYSRFLKQINAAIIPKPEPIINEEDGLPVDYNSQPLKEALLRIERDDASRKMRILAVDDSIAMLNTVSSLLKGYYMVHGIAMPAMVESFLEQVTPDLFLLDYEMPEINGFKLMRIIRKFEEHKDTPIIFVTSLGTTEHVSEAAKLGACDFVVKPFNGDNLREKIGKHITRKKLIY